ncbi:hypothetical protein C477_04804 [Haloterrigena salina JCM 13891]|uniref:Uncharacterized protein n=1 Tax=Haloterrigena salina JCM 13891 TaxID=1227488 RepID=M0CF90_9EURY|nr:hypothetical protein [Haloterrigena salina]ELZ21930.1 hypothetical protein C477_04804 [Haloterrigena salina JCM 13891]
MRRSLAFGLGLFMALAPERIVEPAERLAFENPHVGRLRPWTLPIGRLEGLLVVWLVGRRSDGTTVLEPLVAGLGVVLALAPRTALRLGLRTAYENPTELEVKPWVVPATRLVGACYLVAGLFAGRGAAPEDDGRERAAIGESPSADQ